MSETKHCPQCGAEIEFEGQEYCWNCGASLAGSQPAAEAPKEPEPQAVGPQAQQTVPRTAAKAAPQASTAVPQQTRPVPTGSGVNKLLIGIIVALVVVLVGVVAYLLGSKGGDSSSPSASRTLDVTAAYSSTPSADVPNASSVTTAQDDSQYDEFQPDEDEPQWEDEFQPDGYDFTCEREVTAADISGMSKDELRIMRNWIFARHGYKFKSRDLQEYFGQFDWYEPLYTDVTSQLSSIEKRNIEFIKRHE